MTVTMTMLLLLRLAMTTTTTTTMVTIRKPASPLPFPRHVNGTSTGLGVKDAGQQALEALEIDWFQDPAVEAGLHV